MKYSTGQPVAVGDQVIADGMAGVVVCDFDNREFLEGYLHWGAPPIAISDGTTLSSGIMVNTTEAGMIYYQDGVGRIEFVKGAQTRREI